MYNKQKERLSPSDNLSIFMVPGRSLSLPKGGNVRYALLQANTP